MKIRRLCYGLPYEPYIHEPELRFFEGELMGEQEPPPAQPRLFEYEVARYARDCRQQWLHGIVG